MILDNIRNLSDYEALGFDSRKIQAFIERAEKENLPEGRYELDGDKLFAMIQIYETKDREECLYESHRLYADIQYMMEGTERIYAADIDILNVTEDRTPDADIIFYDRSIAAADVEEEAAMTLRQGSFALFLPQDGHMPCCRYQEKQMVKKLVFKLRFQ